MPKLAKTWRFVITSSKTLKLSYWGWHKLLSLQLLWPWHIQTELQKKVKKQGHEKKNTVWKEDEGWIHKMREREVDKTKRQIQNELWVEGLRMEEKNRMKEKKTIKPKKQILDIMFFT